MSHFSIPEHVIIGRNALKEAKNYLKSFGNRALVVTGKHVGKSPMMDQLKKILAEENISYYVFDGITGEPTDKMIEEGVSLYKKYSCEFCIGIGGGSPLDSAKAIAAMAKKEGKISEYNGKEITGEIPKVVAIPTTSGTGSETTKFTVITDKEKDIKMLLKGDCLVPNLAIIDYDFTIDMPKSVTASTGIDALTHAIEAFTSKKAFCLTAVYAISDVMAIGAIRAILDKGLKVPDDISIAGFDGSVLSQYYNPKIVSIR